MSGHGMQTPVIVLQADDIGRQVAAANNDAGDRNRPDSHGDEFEAPVVAIETPSTWLQNQAGKSNSRIIPPVVGDKNESSRGRKRDRDNNDDDDDDEDVEDNAQRDNQIVQSPGVEACNSQQRREREEGLGNAVDEKSEVNTPLIARNTPEAFANEVREKNGVTARLFGRTTREPIANEVDGKKQAKPLFMADNSGEVPANQVEAEKYDSKAPFMDRSSGRRRSDDNAARASESDEANAEEKEKMMESNGDVAVPMNGVEKMQGTKEAGGYERSKWSNKTEYILSTMGYCIGVGNLWRFPYICIRNGGGAFLIPFFLSLLFLGLPLFFLETVLGQFASKSSSHVWCVCPVFKGVGAAMSILSATVLWYYNVIMAWALYYAFSSFKSTLPWTLCGQWWNTDRCQVLRGLRSQPIGANLSSAVTNSSASGWLSEGAIASNLSSAAINSSSDWLYGENATKGYNLTSPKWVSAAEEFWQHNVLQVSSGFGDSGHVVWYLAVSMLVSTLFLFLGMIKGIKSSGKVVYITATAPYVLLTVLIIRGVTLPGAMDGILFYLRPDFSRLAYPQVWVEAAQQVFWSLGPAWGTLIAMASYNRFNNNCLKDSIFLTFACEGTSFYAGFAIFSILGFMAHEAGVAVDKVVSSGPGLAFIVYPEAVSLLPLPQLWAVLFFVMVVALVFDSQIAYAETLLTVIADYFPRTVHRYRVLITALFCAAFYLLQLPFVTQGGVYLFQLVDWYMATYTLIIIGIIECIALSWFYGLDRISADIRLMIGSNPPLFMTLMWKYITPSLMLVLLGFTLSAYQPPTYGSYHYNDWAVAFGWTIATVSFLPIPAVVIYQLAKASGTLVQRLRQATTPDDNWGPSAHCDAQQLDSVTSCST